MKPNTDPSLIWDEYQRAYTDVLSQCSFNYAPWYIIPANHKWFRNLAVSQILVDTLESLNMKYPVPQVDLSAIKVKYHAELVEEQGGASTLPAQLTQQVQTSENKEKKKGKKKKKG
jgi:hypothetical protein